MGTIFPQDVLHNARAETLKRGINWFKFNARNPNDYAMQRTHST